MNSPVVVGALPTARREGPRPAVSLRRRLGRIVLVLLGGFAAQWLIADRMIVHVGESEMATRLQHDADSLVTTLSVDAQGALQVDARRAGVVYEQPFSGHYFVLRTGAQLLRSASFGEVPPFEPPPADRDAVDRIDGPRGQPLLVLTRRIDVAGRPVALAVAEDLTALRHQLREFRLLFFSASLGVLLAALLLQAREIRRALAPIESVRDAILKLPAGGEPVALEGAPAEIQPLIDEINRLMAFVETRLRQSRTSIGNLSHALKTPLAGLFRLLDDERLAPHADLQRQMRQQADAIRTRIERELKRARLAGDQRAGTRFDPRAEMPALVELLGRIHRDKAPVIEWHAPAGVLPFEREDLLELIGTLADNACKWAARRVVIELRLQHGLDLVVADDGPGCADELLASLGARGQRADESVPGHGLGLAIARDIVEAAGGQLAFRRSAALGGLEVSAHLPG
ncbi:sensor histidine kinase [Aquabacterium humicola]|uniref:sensor histidine kinase n=1 Tax=Aquabacterium humicola TaxID=3237377 RepID=UPI0025435654|nr:sensor histidine kinase [Rubrivivax pictus]